MLTSWRDVAALKLSEAQLRIDLRTGLASHARYVASPNCDERPSETVVDLVVIHGISLPPGRFGGPWIDALFTNTLDADAHPYFDQLRGLRVSSHLLIRRPGELVQYVPLHRRAWHAGASRFEGRERCNDFSIGIELEGEDHRPYTEAQYRRLIRLLRAIMLVYPTVTPARIVGHCHVAPERKTDPGPAFNWQRLQTGLVGTVSEEALCTGRLITPAFTLPASGPADTHPRRRG